MGYELKISRCTKKTESEKPHDLRPLLMA